MGLIFLFLFQSFALEIPPNRYLLGLEATATSKDLIESQFRSEVRELIRNSRKIPIEWIPEHEVYFKKIYELFSPSSYTRSKLLTDGRNRPGVQIILGDFVTFYKYDAHVIEITKAPFFAEHFKRLKPQFKHFLFDVPRSVGLWPMRNWGMHHFHLDVDAAFKNNPLFYRNFWADELAQQRFYEMVGEDIECRTLSTHEELGKIFRFIQDVIDPLILEWQRQPRVLSPQEIQSSSRQFGFEILGRDHKFRNEHLTIEIIKDQMGLQIIEMMHFGLLHFYEDHIRQYGGTSIMPRLIKNPSSKKFSSTIEWRRIPGLLSIDETELWITYFVHKMEFLRQRKDLIALRPPKELLGACQKIENFNSHLLRIGLLPERYRPFLLPEYKNLRVPIDRCRLRLVRQTIGVNR